MAEFVGDTNEFAPLSMRRADVALLQSRFDALGDQFKAEMEAIHARSGGKPFVPSSPEQADMFTRGELANKRRTWAALVLACADAGKLHPDERNELVNEAHFIDAEGDYLA